MATGSIESPFKFESYKIDTLRLDAKKELRLLASNDAVPEQEWNVNLRLRHPLFFEEDGVYVGGVEARLFILNDEGKAELDGDQEISRENFLLTLEAGIAGMFRVQADALPKEVEEKLVKIQIPAILLPYLRAAMTSLLANAGYGSVMFPLFNIHALAEKTMGDVEVEVVKKED